MRQIHEKSFEISGSVMARSDSIMGCQNCRQHQPILKSRNTALSCLNVAFVVMPTM